MTMTMVMVIFLLLRIDFLESMIAPMIALLPPHCPHH
jgi:hypothetical protein